MKHDKSVQAARFGLPDDGAWRRSYMRLPATVGEIGGFPIKAYGRIFIYGASPDFEQHVILQRGTQTPQRKIRPRKSWELRENYCGSMVSWQPRLPQNDFQPFLAVNLIDGDFQTAWASRGESQPDVAPAWVRVDLAAEARLRDIILVPRKDGHPWPRELTVKLSQDAWHWQMVYDSRGDAPPAGEPVRVPLPEATRAKQIWISGDQLAPDGIIGDHTFSCAEVEARDEQDENVALFSRGAGVTTSSTNYGSGSAWDYYDLIWPTQYDLGAKWMRLSAGNGPNDYDTLQWRFVEQERGRYLVDEKTHQALAEATANGCQTMVILCFSNWLYLHAPEKAVLTRQSFPTEATPWSLSTREEFEGYKSFVHFMVKAYKGTVAYWEILNETVGGDEEGQRRYCDLVKEVAPIIRETDPEVKISLAGVGGVPGFAYEWAPRSDWMNRLLDKGVGPLVDAIGWHIQCDVHPGWDPASDSGACGNWVRVDSYPGLAPWKDYAKVIRDLQHYAEASGFRGKYMASEYWLGDPYPVNRNWGYPPHRGTPGITPMTELRKAKDLARTYVLNAGLGVTTFYCNTWFEAPQNGDGIFRNTWAADPLSPCQPEASYYAMRNVCTVLDGVKPTEMTVEFSEGNREFDNWNFRLPEGDLLVGLWLSEASVDRHPGVTTDVIVHSSKCRKVIGIDTLNGFEQELRFEQRGDRLVIPAIVARDYPLMLRLETN